jgi:hypothetical protein
LAAVVSLALARLWRGPLRWLLIVAGIAVATVLPLSAAATAAATSNQALRHGLAALPPGEQSLIVSYPDLAIPRNKWDGFDAQVRSQLGTLTAGPVRAQMLFHQMNDGKGQGMFIGAADDLASAVRIVSGRMPTSCTPTRCEVVLVGDDRPDLPADLGFVIVGTAGRTDPLLLSGTFEPKRGLPLLLADGAAQAGLVDSLTAFQRQYGWVAPLDLDRVSADLPAYLAASQRAYAQLQRYSSGLFLTAPDDVLHREADRAERSTRRFGLLGGAATALLVGFAVIGAIGARRDHRAVVALLRRRGATTPQLTVFTGLTAIVPVLFGTAIGLLCGFAVAGAAAFHGGVLTPVALTAVAAAAILAGTLSWAPEHAWRVLDGVVVAGAAVAVFALARGAVTISGLQQRTDPLLVALPILAVVCGGLLAGRIFPLLVPAGVRAARRLPRRWELPVRLGLSGSARRPLRAVATVAFLAAATGIVVFAGGYRATLSQGAEDQAAFAVPVDATLHVGPPLRRPLDVAPLADYEALAPGTLAGPVLRSTTGIRLNAAESRAADLIGVPPELLTRIPAWNRITGGSDAANSARLITRPGTTSGWAVPDGARRMTMTITGPTTNTNLLAWFRGADGQSTSAVLKPNGAAFAADLPALREPRTLYALTIAETADYGQRRQHHTGEGGSDVPVLSGHLTFADPAFDGTALGASGDGRPPGIETDYELSAGQNVIPVNPPAAEAALPVIADPITASAAVGGVFDLGVPNAAPIPARVVQVLPRFPASGERFVVTDVRALTEALDARVPGTGTPAELWVSSSDSAQLGQALRQAPYDQLDVSLQAATRRQLATDPLATGASSLLWTGALTALAVAVLSLVLLVVAERRDDAAELYAWESDGLTPAALRGLLFARAAAVVVVAVPCGLLLGLLLTRITTALVLVTAVGSVPRPPLALAASPADLAIVLGTGIGVGLLAAGLVALRSFREALPTRPEAL